MLRLNTVIADSDENYVNRLMKHLIDHHGSKFQVHSFTNKEVFKKYIEENSKIIDVVVTTQEMYFEELDDIGIKLICVLDDGKLLKEYTKCEILDKFQLAESIANNVLKKYTEKTDIIITAKGERDTKTIAVYSPISGSGKTTIAYSIALKLAHSGQRVFYLNFEDNATTEMFFDTKGDEDLSQILFYLKAQVKNLALKIDFIKKEDPNTGINYFNPLKSNLELEEITAKEYAMLLRELKNLSNYDYIIVDLGSGFNEKIAEVLNQVDNIVLTIVNDITLKVKTAGIIKDFEILYERKRTNLYNKIYIIENKFKEINSLENEFLVGGIGVSQNIPFSEQLYYKNGEKYSINVTGEYGKAIEKLIQKIG